MSRNNPSLKRPHRGQLPSSESIRGWAAELYRSGLSIHQIASLIGYTAMSIHAWLKKQGIARRTSAEGARLRSPEMRRFNEHAVHGDTASLFCTDRSGKHWEILVDLHDLERLREHGHGWYVVKRSYTRYAKALGPDSKNMVYLHNFLLGISCRQQHVDHINHNGLDNRRANLRLASASMNGLNRKGPRPGTRSGIRGVSWSSQKQKWQARICVKRRAIHLGFYTDANEAGQAVAAKLRELGVTCG